MTSGTTGGSHSGISRNRDGVPGWNAEPSLFTEYEEECLIWVQSVPWHKRQLCGPKLIQELTGPARRLVLGQPPDWTAQPQGVEALMRHLRSCLGKPMLPELSDFLLRYFRSSKRRPNESMGDYITKKCEVYMRSCQALQRVLPYHKAEKTASEGRYGRTTPMGAVAAAWIHRRVTPPPRPRRPKMMPRVRRQWPRRLRTAAARRRQWGTGTVIHGTSRGGHGGNRSGGVYMADGIGQARSIFPVARAQLARRIQPWKSCLMPFKAGSFSRMRAWRRMNGTWYRQPCKEISACNVWLKS